MPLKLYGTKSEKTSAFQIEGQMSLFNEIEISVDPDAHELKLVEVENHFRKRKYEGQREELVKSLPHNKVLHVMDESVSVVNVEPPWSMWVKNSSVPRYSSFQQNSRLSTITEKLTNAGHAGNREPLIWKKLPFPTRRYCIPIRPRLRSHGWSITNLNLAFRCIARKKNGPLWSFS